MQRNGTLDLLFGIGFKIGFLVVIVGLLMFYMPLLDMVVSPTLDLMGFWGSFRELPEWVQVVVTGVMLVGAAIVVGSVKELTESMVDQLFGRDEF